MSRGVGHDEVGPVGAADDQRVHPQPELVEQAMLDHQARHRTDAVLHDVLARVALISANWAATSPVRTWVFSHVGSVSVVDTTYLRIVLN